MINPATEEVIAEVIEAHKEEVNKAVKAAKQAFPRWNATPPEKRKEHIGKVLEIIKRRKDELAETIVSELGASINFTTNGQLPLSINEIQATLEEFEISLLRKSGRSYHYRQLYNLQAIWRSGRT
ncbi:MAG: aldehyde dehydrogenase family protein [Micrococcaceae bacterium]